MTTDASKKQLLEQFQDYLENSTLNSFETGPQPDLSRVLSELAALKTEVKTESRLFKNTLDTLDSTLTGSLEENKALLSELAEQRKQLSQQQDNIIRTLLLDFIDIYDRLNSATEILQNYRPMAKIFNRSKTRDVHFIKRFKEGQLMTVRRFEHLLQRYQISPMKCVGQVFDPNTMNAVETGNDPDKKKGVVLEELVPGFLYKNQVLRLAEVKVNKSTYQQNHE